MKTENKPFEPPVGLRQRKRQETFERIQSAGLRLFSLHGYEATTLDAIATEAGISRRTFFAYFKSKDDILLSLQTGLGESLRLALDTAAPGRTPLAAMRHAMLAIVDGYDPDALIAIDRLMISSEAVQARKQASYIEDEAIILSALRQRWPEEPVASLQLLAMTCIGITRIAMDAWRREDRKNRLSHHVAHYFDVLAASAR